MKFEVLLEDEHLVAINKPAGFSVHTPEHQNSYFIPKWKIILNLLRDQLSGTYLYPVHRLDHATTGVLIYAKTKESASKLASQFNSTTNSAHVKKYYHALVRGFVTQTGELDKPLQDEGKLFEARTHFQKLHEYEFDFPVGKYPTARYSIVEVIPQTGRRHQIRKHFKHFGHPIIGDSTHGDGEHNRFFSKALGLPGLFLHAYKLQFLHPVNLYETSITAPYPKLWSRFFKLIEHAKNGDCRIFNKINPAIDEPEFLRLKAY